MRLSILKDLNYEFKTTMIKTMFLVYYRYVFIDYEIRDYIYKVEICDAPEIFMFLCLDGLPQ